MEKDKKMNGLDSKKLKIDNIYIVEWVDTFTVNEWQDTDDIDDYAKNHDNSQQTTGWFVGVYYDWYVFSATINPDKNYKRYGVPKFIPKGCIKKVTLLKTWKG